MNKEWVDKKNRSRLNKQQRLLSKIKKKLVESGLFEKAEVTHLLNRIKDGLYDARFAVGLDFSYILRLSALKFGSDPSEERSAYLNDSIRLGEALREDFDALFDTLNDFVRFQDSGPIEFDGDIIITDPCYVTKDDDDWERSNYGSHMELLGVEHFMTRDTIYGDWSCTVFDTDTKKPIGTFCADAGLVSVILLDEVLRYNPSFDYHENRTWTTALICDFKGTVQFVVTEGKFTVGGEKYTDYEVSVVGHGVNKVTGEPINFVSSQTGL